MTDQEKLEFALCHKDFNYFAKYVKVVHPIKGLVTLAMHDYQKRLIQEAYDNRFLIGTKYRCGGFTTTIVAWLLWRALFHINERVMVNCKTDREATFINSIVRKIYWQLPDFLQEPLSRENDHQLTFEHESNMWFYTWEACCGKAMSILYLDEPAFMPNMDAHWKAIWPTLSCGGKAIALSTPNGKQGWFYETHRDAIAGKNQWHVYKTDFKECPEFNDDAWIEQAKGNLGQIGWRSEVLQEFVDPFREKINMDVVNTYLGPNARLLEEFGW